jgi:peptidoglycan-associated lipoprotein
MVKTWLALVLVAGSVAAFGCSSSKAPAKTVAAPEAPAARPARSPAQEKALDEAEAKTGGLGLGIDDAILKLCPAVKPPRFDYDSAQIKTAFRDTISELAECMKAGGLQGKSVLLVGHADRRGEEDYNMALGGRRASSVRGALQSFGVEESRLDVSSRGALDAKGTEESSWSKDRRVDIKLKM